MILSALHFEQKSIEEIMKPAAKHLLDIQQETVITKLHSLFYQGDLLENLKKCEVWSRIPRGERSMSQSALMECLARCIETQIIWIDVFEKRLISHPYPYGIYFSPHRKIFVVRFLYANMDDSFYIAAEPI